MAGNLILNRRIFRDGGRGRPSPTAGIDGGNLGRLVFGPELQCNLKRDTIGELQAGREREDVALLPSRHQEKQRQKDACHMGKLYTGNGGTMLKKSERPCHAGSL